MRRSIVRQLALLGALAVSTCTVVATLQAWAETGFSMASAPHPASWTTAGLPPATLQAKLTSGTDGTAVGRSGSRRTLVVAALGAAALLALAGGRRTRRPLLLGRRRLAENTSTSSRSPPSRRTTLAHL